MKVFLDVGAHIGQTLTAALRWDFDRVVCFEPARQHRKRLEELADARTEVNMFGLWNVSERAKLYNIGAQGASLWQRPERPVENEVCKFQRASDWLRDNTTALDIVWMKINTEGAELDIVTDLLDSGTIARIRHLLVMWDARKIPELEPRLNSVRDRLRDVAPHVLPQVELPPAATRMDRIDDWLNVTGGVRRI